MKKGLFSKLVVMFVISANSIFAAAVLYVFLRTGAEPQALIAAWFGFTTTEVWALSNIKKSKEATKQSENKGKGDL